MQVQLLLILHEPEEIFDEFGDLEPIASLQILKKTFGGAGLFIVKFLGESP